MTRRRLVLTWTLVFAACLGTPLAAAQAQTDATPAALVRAMGDAVTRLDYETAEARAFEALRRYNEFSPDQLLEIHTTLGTLLHARGAAVEARNQFVLALQLDPNLELDPVFVSPTTVAFFEEVRQEVETPAIGAGAPEVRYVVLEDRRPGAALRSLAAPGWGQFYKDDDLRGWAYAGAAVLAAGGLVASAVQVGVAGEDYREAEAPAEIAAAYEDYDRAWTRRRAFAVGTAAVWAVAMLDALVTGAPEAPARPGRLRLDPAPEAGGLRLRIGL